MDAQKLLFRLRHLTFLLLFAVLLTPLACNLLPKTTYKPKEVTFAKGCWKKDVFAFPGNNDEDQINEECDKPVELIWPSHRFPLRIAMNKDPELKKAMDLWNKMAGTELFVPGGVSYDILVFTDFENKEVGAIATAGVIKDSGGHMVGGLRLLKQILIADDKSRLEVYFHELGHILGLGLDVNNPASIMYTSLSGGLLTHDDLRAIRDRYGKK